MTEAEAKTKWCPFAKVAGAHVSMIGNRWGDQPSGLDLARFRAAARCIGADCMAWRLEPDTRETISMVIEASGSVHEAEPFLRSGHCGLAGDG